MSYEAAYAHEEPGLMDSAILLARYERYIIVFSFAAMMLMHADDLPVDVSFNCNHECTADVA